MGGAAGPCVKVSFLVQTRKKNQIQGVEKRIWENITTQKRLGDSTTSTRQFRYLQRRYGEKSHKGSGASARLREGRKSRRWRGENPSSLCSESLRNPQPEGFLGQGMKLGG